MNKKIKYFCLLLLLPIFCSSQNIHITGTTVDGKEFVDDVVMSIKDTGDTFYSEYILSKAEFSIKLSTANVFIITFTKQYHLQRSVIVNTHNFPSGKTRFIFDIEIPIISTNLKENLYGIPTIYYDNGIKYKYK